MAEEAIKLNILEPRATEKTYNEQTKRTYVFPVDLKTSKQEVAKLVEKEFNVTVTDVRVLIRKGKATKFSRGKHAYPGTTYRRDKKYAYVTLAEGGKIKVFDEPEEEKSDKEKKAEAKKEIREAEKAAKAEEKAAKKESKTSAKDTSNEADKNAGKENK